MEIIEGCYYRHRENPNVLIRVAVKDTHAVHSMIISTGQLITDTVERFKELWTDVTTH